MMSRIISGLLGAMKSNEITMGFGAAADSGTCWNLRGEAQDATLTKIVHVQ